MAFRSVFLTCFESNLRIQIFNQREANHVVENSFFSCEIWRKYFKLQEEVGEFEK